MNEVYQELLRYRLIIVWASLVIGLLWLLAIGCALMLQRALISFTAGGLLGSTLSLINVFAMGFSVYRILIIKTSRIALLLPIATFIILIAGALFSVQYFPASALGYAIGLCSPLILGATIAFFIGHS